MRRKKKRFGLSYYKLEKICSGDVWASVLGYGGNEVGIRVVVGEKIKT